MLQTTDAIKVHVTGAAGTGTTSLGAALAGALGVVHLDTDRFYWRPTDPPYMETYPVAERLTAMRAATGEGGWVISGSLDGWGDPLVEDADLIVFLTAPVEIRLGRLRTREMQRFGARIAPGGDMEHLHASFLVWSSQYEDAGFTGRSRLRHETWLAAQPAPVLRLDATEPVDTLMRRVLERLG